MEDSPISNPRRENGGVKFYVCKGGEIIIEYEKMHKRPQDFAVAYIII